MNSTRIFKLPKSTNNLKETSFITSSYIQEPMISLGFNLFMMKNKEKLEIVKNLPESQKEIHHIFNIGNITIPSQPEKSISGLFINKFFKKQEVDLEDSFFHVWEILTEFSLLKTKDSIVALSIGDSPGSALQSFITYRQLHQSKSSSKDMYCGLVSLGTEENIKCYSNAKVYKDTFEKKVSSNSIKLFKKGFLAKVASEFTKKKQVDLIFCDTELEWFNENYQEQEAIRLIFGEIIFGLNLLEKEGTLIIKIFDTYTDLTIKAVSIFSSFFKETVIYKPLTSSEALSEKYLIGLNFIHHKENLKILQALLKELEKEESFLVNLENYKIDEGTLKEIIQVNQNLSNLQYNIINKMYAFIQGKNYFGVDYHNQVAIQVEHAEKWMKYFSL